MYTLHETGRINKGSSHIKDLADLFQQVLNIDPGENYPTYIDIRSQKNNQTKSLDRMKKNLI
ncbi:RteC domain-containing protein [Aequorivita sinensis]|uniref:RteC domain-containing protein n=1 Tax=Aequorivita sinensis TaxID=1382458 RepID=UPI00111DF084